MVFLRVKALSFTCHAKVLTRKASCDNIHIFGENLSACIMHFN